jgi:hypothetical protein
MMRQLVDSPVAAKRIFRDATSWRNGLLAADLAPLEAKAAAGDLDAKARVRMLDSIAARKK